MYQQVDIKISCNGGQGLRLKWHPLWVVLYIAVLRSSLTKQLLNIHVITDIYSNMHNLIPVSVVVSCNSNIHTQRKNVKIMFWRACCSRNIGALVMILRDASHATVMSVVPMTTNVTKKQANVTVDQISLVVTATSLHLASSSQISTTSSTKLSSPKELG